MGEGIKERDDIHIPLKIDENGLVIKVGYDMGGSYEYTTSINGDDKTEEAVRKNEKQSSLFPESVEYTDEYVKPQYIKPQPSDNI